MKKYVYAAGALISAGFAMDTALAQSITPDSFSATIGVGETVSINKSITVGAGFTNLDLFFLADNTGSMGGIISTVKSTAGTLLSNLATTYSGARFGVGRYLGDPIEGVAAASAYQLQLAMTNSQANAQTAINAWFASGGGDTPEANFFALHQVATQGAPTPGTNVSTGSVTGWTPGSERVVIMFGDAPAHNETINMANTIAALNANGVSLIALNNSAAGTGIDGSFGGDAAQASTIAGATGGTQIVNALSLTPAALQAAIEAAIGTIASDIDLVFESTAGAGLNVVFTCTDAAGCDNVGAGGTRTFRVDITGLAPGVYDFTVFARGVAAVETDRIIVGEGEVPAPATLALLGAALAGLGIARRRRAA